MIYIYNPQIAMYSTSIWGRIINKKEHDKLSYIIDLAREEPNNYCFVTDGLVSSFPLYDRIPFSFIKKALSYIEFLIWCKINKLPFTLSTNKIDSNDILFSMASKSSVLKNDSYKKSLLYRIDCKKVLHMSHFFESTSVISKNSKDCRVDFSCAEAPLNITSPYYNHFFSHIGNSLFVPFALRDKYKSYKPFDERINSCLAIGTTHNMVRSKVNEDFQKYFGIESWHKMRRIIYANQDTTNSSITCRISDFHNDENIKPSDGVINKLYNILFGHKQKNYMSFDIVELFNEYRMFVSPEEEVGLPSINMIEGIACGCLYFGSHEEIYHSYGMEPGIHYVLYKKNDLDDLVSKIEYYKANIEEAKIIAKNGTEHIIHNFKNDKVKKIFKNSLELV